MVDLAELLVNKADHVHTQDCTCILERDSLSLCKWESCSCDCGSVCVGIFSFYTVSLLSAITGALKYEKTGNNILRIIKV